MTLVEFETEVREVRRPQKSLGIVGGGGNYPGRGLAQSSVFPRSRRLHYVSTSLSAIATSLWRAIHVVFIFAPSS